MAPRTGFTLPVDPLNELGNPEDVFKSPPVLQFIRTLIDIIRRQFESTVKRDTAAPYFHLSSPNGTAFIVTVGDDGVLRTQNARQRQIDQITNGA